MCPCIEILGNIILYYYQKIIIYIYSNILYIKWIVVVYLQQDYKI
jgi:hypothetical protein